MKWTGITGTWRFVNERVEEDVRRVVKSTMLDGGAIVAGGALGVDFIATDEALKYDTSGDRVKVILPVPLPLYNQHFQNMIKHRDSVTESQVSCLMSQFEEVRKRNPENLVELPNERVHRTTFHQRNAAIVDVSSNIVAFQVNNSTGTQNTINTAISLKKPVHIFSYSI